MAEITDLLSLNYSQSFNIQGMQEADINLSLNPAVTASATVYGTVTDGTNPLPNATVKLFDSQGVPYRHVLTDTEGAYAFTNVPAGTYTVAAACAGHLMSPGAGLTLTGGDSLQVPLVCAPETTLSLGAIAGLVTSTGLEGILPVAGATITLRDLTGAAVASTTSADDGEFVFLLCGRHPVVPVPESLNLPSHDFVWSSPFLSETITWLSPVVFEVSRQAIGPMRSMVSALFLMKWKSARCTWLDAEPAPDTCANEAYRCGLPLAS